MYNIVEKGGEAMDEIGFINKVDDDIEYSCDMFNKFPNDKEKMKMVFNKILFDYIGKITGIENGLQVIFDCGEKQEETQTYRANVKILIDRLIIFRNNNYNNENIEEKFRLHGESISFNTFKEDYTNVRLAIGMLKNISQSEMEEIMRNLDEMEEIAGLAIIRKERWNRMRPYVMWISGKSIEVAEKILPLFLNI